MTMQTGSETHRQVSSKLAAIAKTIRLTGWLTLWVQLALVLVSGLALVFVSTGRRFAEQPNRSLGFGIFWAGLGILMLFFSIYWDFRYTRIGRRLANPNPSLHPSKADTLGIIRLGVIASLIGILFTILGAISTASLLIAKSISQPPGVAITDPNRIIRALDVFVVVANLNGIAAHFIGVIASLWLIEKIIKN